jgi:uncharacterized membrane protein
MASSANVLTLDPRDLLLVAVRWLHAAAAVVLVGASTFNLVYLGAALRDDGSAVVRQATARGFRELLDLSLAVFLLSGGLLTFERLSSGAASSVYLVVLGLKLLLCFLLYRWAFAVRRSGDWTGRDARLLVSAGFAVVLLAVVLKTLYEAGLRS